MASSREPADQATFREPNFAPEVLSSVADAEYPRYELFNSLIFKINRLASLYFKGSSRYYQQQFGMGVPEVRLLNIIGSMPHAGAQEVVELSSMDKGLVSRSLGDLIRRHYLRKIQDPQDRRRFTLKLTPSGLRIYQRIKSAKHSRHLRAVAGMTPEECRQLYVLLDKALVTAKAMAATDSVVETKSAGDHEGYSHPWPPAGLLDIVPDLAGTVVTRTRGQVSR